MPRFRPEITALSPYVVGRPIEEVVREFGMTAADVVKLASNESPEGPFPGVVDAVTPILGMANRYPDNDAWDLVGSLAGELGVEQGSVLLANGSVALIGDIANALGGPGTNVVYAWPSFVMYRFAAVWAGSDAREIPLTDGHGLDLVAMAEAVDSSTSLVFLCNPNNPTGTVLPGDEVEAFVDSMPESVMVVIDEAYHEFAGPPYRSMVSLAARMRNVVVLRTFSKVYALAAFRIGYGVGHPDTIAEIRKIQAPLTVNRVAQAAALASLGQAGEVARRVRLNDEGRRYLSSALADRGLSWVPSHANFVFFEGPGDGAALAEKMTRSGVIIRPMGGSWLRVTVGLEEENRRFVEVLDSAL